MPELTPEERDWLVAFLSQQTFTIADLQTAQFVAGIIAKLKAQTE